MTSAPESPTLTMMSTQTEASTRVRETLAVRSSATTTAERLLSGRFRADTAAPTRAIQVYTQRSSLHMNGYRKPSRRLIQMIQMNAQKRLNDSEVTCGRGQMVIA